NKSTMTYDNNIKDKDLIILLPTTGNKWSQLLEYFYDKNCANDLYERIIYWCISSADFVQEDILCYSNLPSIEILYLIRFLIGHRVYEFTDEAYAYLNLLRKNEQQPEIQTKARIDNKREEALERRSADIVGIFVATKF
ncbi:unnamed protein product, partial [Didymodactylos carnosus]